jgi:LAGLIDADG DNA endonuclease family protein
MESENPFGADNQQETKDATQRLDPSWIVGFVDGEGCFSVGIHRNPRYARRTGGWQLTPTFQVYQHEKEQRLLERFRDHFDCGKLYHKGPNSTVMTYSVARLVDLEERILPFFTQHRLLVKDEDFTSFAKIVRSMRRKEHLHPDGFDILVRLAYSMNLHGKQRARPIEDILQGSSETIRQAPP